MRYKLPMLLVGLFWSLALAGSFFYSRAISQRNLSDLVEPAPIVAGANTVERLILGASATPRPTPTATSSAKPQRKSTSTIPPKYQKLLE